MDGAAAEELLNFEVSYVLNDNLTTIKLMDLEEIVSVSFVSDVDVIAGVHWDERLVKDRLESLNGVLRLDKTIMLSARKPTYTAYIDLHTTRKLYLTSSSLASYSIISTCGNDVLSQKQVMANYGQMLFDGLEAGFDYLDVSRRALQRIDFKLQDSFGNVLDLRGNHWSFSLVFQTHT